MALAILILNIATLVFLLTILVLGIVAFAKIRGWCAYVSKQCSDILLISDENAETIEDAEKKLLSASDRIEKLEKGLIPDHEAAKKATDEVNKFVNGVGAIFGYDPFQALKASRGETKEEREE